METTLEWTLTNSYKADMISYLQIHPEDFDEAVKLAISDKQPNPGGLHGNCVAVWEKPGKKPSVRYNAFKIIVKIAKKHPDLYHEIGFLIQDQYMDSLSTTVKRSILKILNGFN